MLCVNRPDDMKISYPYDDIEFRKRLDEIIAENLTSEDLNVVFLSNRMYMSLSTFFRRIKAATGMGGNEYIRSKRIEKALSELQNAKREGVTMAISDVAFACGFASLSSFDKAFRNKLGITPTEYMKEDGQRSDG